MSDDKQIRIDKVRELQQEKGDRPWPGGGDNTANVVRERRYLSELLEETEAKRRMALKSRRGFLIGGFAALAGILGWRWVSDEAKGALFRRTFEFNEKVGHLFYRPSRLAPEFPLSSVSPERVNGLEGLGDDLDLATWRLRVSGLQERAEGLMLSLDDIKQMPRTEMTTELKCIEGWSIIVHWAGVRFTDFLASCFDKLKTSRPQEVQQYVNVSKYVSLSTPDDAYFVGWDIQSILHPQTLLAYEMNGAPLTPEHGAPLRLASPTKYGIKQIKRIGSIEFTNERPRDFWAEYDYDWYSGH